jgi:hypothetical protein
MVKQEVRMSFTRKLQLSATLVSIARRAVAASKVRTAVCVLLAMVAGGCSGSDDTGSGTPLDTENDSGTDSGSDSNSTSPVDLDRDGYGDDVDCDDTDPDVHPGADEYCNDHDDDCDGLTDEEGAVDGSTWYADVDGDGFGDAEVPFVGCVRPPDFVELPTDCDDADPARHPGATETCDGVDSDCDGISDDRDAIDTTTWYPDADGDRYGDPAHATPACEQPSGYTSDASDCDDASSTVFPGANEVCGDDIDQDCDGADIGCGYFGDVGLGDEDVIRLVGAASGDQAGKCVSGAGDVDADGYADFLVGAPGSNRSVGSAYLLYGPVRTDGILSRADATFAGEDSGALAGVSVSGAGDVNADGYADILVGAEGEDVPGEPGAVYLLYGPITADRDLSLADARYLGEDSGDQAGAAVSGAGDVNADGFDDIIVGAYRHNDGGNYAGAAYVLSGPLTTSGYLSSGLAELVGENPIDWAGGSVSGAGDVNGDGFSDILVGASGDDTRGATSGAVYLLYGPVAGYLDLSAADVKLLGEAPEDLAGYSVRGAGDVNADGLADILIGAAFGSAAGAYSGAAYLLNGPVTADAVLSSADARLVGEDAQDFAGWSVSGAGDVDADGTDDVLVGAPGNDTAATYAGVAYLLYGPLAGEHDLARADVRFIGEASDTGHAGISVADAGDVDADGHSDVLIGSQYNADGDAPGAAYLILFADMLP